jgi:CheY-like chemotaxis protein
VLVVEDEVVLRMSTVDMLERLGYLVAAVGNAEQALELLDKGNSFDVLLTDLGLPGMSGEELAAEIRRRFPGLPVIVASGYGKSDAPSQGLRFVGKPYSSVDLQQALEEVARRAATA